MNFYICDIHSVAKYQNMHDITKTLSLINDYHKKEYMHPFYDGEHTVIEVRDHEWVQNEHSPNTETIQKILTFRDSIQPTDNVLVHCIGGVSRSPAAMLMILHRWYEPKECIERLDKIRPYAFPNKLMCRLYNKEFYDFSVKRQEGFML